MTPKRKNKVVSFLCSFIPGAYEMYCGFMKMGISLMILCAVAFVLPFMLGFYDISGIPGVIIWFFAFFHARNIDAATDEEFAALKDVYIWEEFQDGKAIAYSRKFIRKWGAVLLILIGINLLWSNVRRFFLMLVPGQFWHIAYSATSELPKVLIAIFLIAAGVKLILGKKAELNAAEIQADPVQKEEMTADEKMNVAQEELPCQEISGEEQTEGKSDKKEEQE